ncbi:hypothetical protein INT47_012229 [Mucor saturninus]|uniref:MULE transposase domain-containing protein n=1 Tax=Mucor saturninus TaxID=64648 RepID=A0A8H7R9Q0_9FUNG|nr:hypothetical protein INT47_012229 [Mucor saturninus]
MPLSNGNTSYLSDDDFQESLPFRTRRNFESVNDVDDLNVDLDIDLDEDLEDETLEVSSTSVPSQLEFSSSETLEMYMIDHCKENCYLVSLGRSRYYPDRRLKSLEFKCDRGGKNSSKSTGKRLSKTRRTDCPFKWVVGSSWRKEQGVYTAKFTLHLNNSGHNHESADSLAGHSIACKIGDDHMKVIKDMTIANSSPQDILIYLRQKFPGDYFRPSTVYNARQKIREEYLDGRSPLQALLDQFSEADSGFIYAYNSNEDSTIKKLFFAHSHSLEMVERFPQVLLTDCTYKTNKYGMPLLHVVGIDCFNKTFFVCGVFLKDETQANYEWAVSTIRMKLFWCYVKPFDPSIIAIDRDLALKGALKTIFDSSTIHLPLAYQQEHDDWNEYMIRWNRCMNSFNEEEWEQNWSAMRNNYGLNPRYLPLFAYLESTWLPLKENFANPWINKYLHLGVINTSRVEGAHNKLKQRLKVSTSHLDKVANLVKSTVEVDASEFKARLEDQKLKVITEVEKRGIMTRNVVLQPLSDCTNTYTVTTGIPCVHRIKALDDQHQVLQVNDFHQQWRLEHSPSSEQLEELDPESNLDYLVDLLRTRFRNAARYEQEEMVSRLFDLVHSLLVHIEPQKDARSRGRPTGSTARRNDTSSNRRNPSAFEHAERRTRLCGTCRQPGHDTRQCSQRVMSQATRSSQQSQQQQQSQ